MVTDDDDAPSEPVEVVVVVDEVSRTARRPSNQITRSMAVEDGDDEDDDDDKDGDDATEVNAYSELIRYDSRRRVRVDSNGTVERLSSFCSSEASAAI
jgi:hypothetical protein